jgi:hypothetical protein
LRELRRGEKLLALSTDPVIFACRESVVVSIGGCAMRKLHALVLFVTLVFFCGEASAVSIFAGGGWSTHSMSDVNDELQILNALIAPLSIDEISGGATYELGVSIPLSSALELGLAYERFSPSSDVGDATGSISYDFAANTYRAFLLYGFPSTSKFKVGIGGALGIVSSAGQVEIRETGGDFASGSVSGSDLLLEGFVHGDYWVSPRVAVFGDAGFRYAKVGEIEVRNTPIYTDTGDRYSVDYSGLSLRVGLKIDVPSKMK